LAELGKNLALFGIAIAPWLPIIAVLALAIRMAIRRVRRARTVTLRPSPPAAPA
jgi:hypothetical protein